ncbi:periodic tryptophan 2 -like protein [Brachionus plicatilis]|uniref:Periodic tryptophan 2-like protein n=1 Tax=Brachionus plicatilis TaxID=10195 RepID=A0A3M7QV17_BRAPC|nr:periodic tryptophan 2 -like protein [Brachionus plicatilis]
MKFNFRFSNLLGTVYSKGNLTFTPDGDSILSPVGNRVTIFDLKNNKSETLPVESQFNITVTEISPDGWLILLVNEEGECLLCNTKSKSVIHRFNFARKVHAVKFSPDGKKFAVCKENKVLLYHAPGKNKEFNPFVLIRTFYGAYDDNICLDWTSDSRVLIAGSKDMSSRVFAAEGFKNLNCYVLGGHSESIVGCFFEKNSLNAYTIGKNGRLNVWESDTELKNLIPKTNEQSEGIGPDTDELSVDKPAEIEDSLELNENDKIKDEDYGKKVQYKKKSKYGIRDALEANAPVALLSCDFHKGNSILVSGFSNGSFLLHELPNFNLIHSLNISQHPVTSCLFNKTGDWIAIACQGLGQLLVWEWQSETYVMKQQGHFNNMSQVAYSPSGMYLASGGEDGKIKIWNTLNGQCFVTFNEHNAPITGIQFKSNGQVVCSASLDGTVRAFDLNRYRNFRTFTTPQPVQFSCLSIDYSGELIAAGGFDVFEIFVWSMQTGHLLQTLCGHEGPISGVAFSPSVHPILASTSWDRTCRTWDVFEGKGSREMYTLSSDALTVCFKPDGKHVAVSTLDAQIVTININEVDQQAIVNTIECRHDLGYSRKETDKVTAKKMHFGKSFKSLCYTMDGEYIIAGGKSKYICIYNVKEEMLVRRFEISQNKSFDGIDEFLDRRKMTEWGNLDLVEKNPDNELDNNKISLPGVVKGDYSSRVFKPEIQVSCVRFSPTARSWSACTTEGLLIYSLDTSLIFDPFDLDMDITPKTIKSTLNNQDYSLALMQALRLNEEALITQVLEKTPHMTIDIVVDSLSDVYVDKLLAFVANQIEKSAHLEFYLIWSQTVLYKHGNRIKQRAASRISILCNLEKALTKKSEDLGKICDSNMYSIDYVLSLNKLKNKRKLENKSQNGVYSDLDDEEMQSESDQEENLNSLKTIKNKQLAK